MAIGHRGHTAAASSADGTAVALTLPAGILGGECILITIGWNNAGSGVTCSTPSGYTVVDTKVTSAVTQTTYMKIAAGTIGAASSDASASVTATLSVSKSWTIAANVYSGTDTTTPIHAHAVGGPSGTGTTHTAPTVTVSVANCWIVQMCAERGTSTAWTVPSGFTARGVPGQTTGVANTLASAADSNGTVATGTRGGDTWTATATSSSVTLQTIALQPTVTTPTAAFTTTTVGTDVICDSSGSSAVGPATITTKAWTFGDGGTGSGDTPKHQYATAGTYTIGLTVTDSNGQTASITHSVTITAPGTSAAISAATAATGTSPTTLATVLTNLTDTSSGSPVLTTWLAMPDTSSTTVKFAPCSAPQTGQPAVWPIIADRIQSSAGTLTAELWEGDPAASGTLRSSVTLTIPDTTASGGSGDASTGTVGSNQILLAQWPWTDVQNVTDWNQMYGRLTAATA